MKRNINVISIIFPLLLLLLNSCSYKGQITRISSQRYGHLGSDSIFALRPISKQASISIAAYNKNQNDTTITFKSIGKGNVEYPLNKDLTKIYLIKQELEAYKTHVSRITPNGKNKVNSTLSKISFMSTGPVIILGMASKDPLAKMAFFTSSLPGFVVAYLFSKGDQSIYLPNEALPKLVKYPTSDSLYSFIYFDPSNIKLENYTKNYTNFELNDMFKKDNLIYSINNILKDYDFNDSLKHYSFKNSFRLNCRYNLNLS